MNFKKTLKLNKTLFSLKNIRTCRYILPVLFTVLPALAAPSLPRKHDAFELGELYQNMMPRLAAFSCNDLGPVVKECVLMGYPRRDDFLVLKFYKGEMVAIAHFLEGISYEEALKEAKQRMGEPSLPAYKSDRAVSNIWKDEKTYITLTNLVKLSYLVYEIRDLEKEPLFRKARVMSK